MDRHCTRHCHKPPALSTVQPAVCWMSGWLQLSVLGLGVFLGYICKGATGFGSAVLLVASWVIANLAGIDAGQAFSCFKPASISAKRCCKQLGAT